ncbi:hypothetical protein CTheo_8496 [Ceratobasidium theobromae]|uniref:Uncharacterized protein n=1 Tax=Ceratobasidium theobromae TaxID=1582974 RepID=A0A5N5Q8F2_9AGAM|nr:hypothetical protein CTheo_8496 [Ceratobasidium theobromae]
MSSSPFSLLDFINAPLNNMYFSAAAIVSAVALFASGVEASHRITLRNNCAWGVGLLLHNWSGTPYTGPAIGSIAAKSSKVITVPDGWDGRICDTPPSSGCTNSCYGACSMTEFNMNSGGLNWYDISNIQAYTVAYRPGDMSGSCGGTGPVDQAVRACGAADFTVVYCP